MVEVRVGDRPVVLECELIEELCEGEFLEGLIAGDFGKQWPELCVGDGLAVDHRGGGGLGIDLCAALR